MTAQSLFFENGRSLRDRILCDNFLKERLRQLRADTSWVSDGESARYIRLADRIGLKAREEPDARFEAAIMADIWEPGFPSPRFAVFLEGTLQSGERLYLIEDFGPLHKEYGGCFPLRRRFKEKGYDVIPAQVAAFTESGLPKFIDFDEIGFNNEEEIRRGLTGEGALARLCEIDRRLHAPEYTITLASTAPSAPEAEK